MSPLMLSLVVGLAAPAAAAEPPPPVSPAALEQAYQREFAYLVAEKRALQARQAALAEESRRARARTERDLDQLQARLLAMERRADAADDRIAAVEDAATATEERAALVDATLSQAEEALGVALSVDAGTGARLGEVYTAAAATLDAGARLHQAPGHWFRPSGEKVAGTVIRVGEVAVFGHAAGDPGASGALLPIGEGRLMLRAEASGQAEAAALAAGGRPDPLGAYWIESVDKPVSERTARSLRETLDAGGMVAWIIAGLGVVALLLAVARGLLLARVGRGTGATAGLAAVLRADGQAAAIDRLGAPATATGRVAAAVLAAPAGLGHEELQDVAAEALLAEQPALDRFGTAIFVVAAVAPLLGLLGTVTGMISTFEIITEFGTGDPKMLSSGISEALITTQLGLVVAIPAVLLGNLLKARAATVGDALECAALGLVNARGAVLAAAAGPGATAAGPAAGAAVTDASAA